MKMMGRQTSFPGFPEPKPDPFDGSTDGFFTDPADADKLACFAKITRNDTVLEPCAGHGSLVHALMRLREPPQKITAYEKHPPFFERLKEECSKYGERVDLRLGDFFESRGRFSVCVMNPPYRNFLDVRFVQHALSQCDRVVALLWSNSLFNKKRSAVWNSSDVKRIIFMEDRPRPFFRGQKKPLKPMRDYVMIECASAHGGLRRQAHRCEVSFGQNTT